MILDLVATLGGMIIPPVINMIKGKVSGNKGKDGVLEDLATMKPELLPQYLEATAKVTETNIKWFNRDVISTPSLWVVNLRSAIRPVGVVLCLGLIGAGLYFTDMDPGIRYFSESVVGSWFGSRIDRT